MNQYSWGTMMDDFTFLESIGRRSEEWGRDIGQKGLLAGHQPVVRGRGRGRGRGAHNTTASRADKRRGYFKAMMDQNEVEVELLPAGMTRRGLNQSWWDSKCVPFLPSCVTSNLC